MRTAIIRIDIDPHGQLSAARYEQGIDQLRAAGRQLVASPFSALPRNRREIEVAIDCDDPAPLVTQIVAAAGSAFGTECRAGTTTFVSRGTDDDVVGVLAGFGLLGSVDRSETADGELVTITLSESDRDRVPESRLHTALEAALNCEVIVVFL